MFGSFGHNLRVKNMNMLKSGVLTMLPERSIISVFDMIFELTGMQLTNEWPQ